MLSGYSISESSMSSYLSTLLEGEAYLIVMYMCEVVHVNVYITSEVHLK